MMKINESVWPNIIVLNEKYAFSINDIRKYCYAESSDEVVISGSLVDSLGNRTSDIDVFVLCSEQPDLTQEIKTRHDFTKSVVSKCSGAPFPKLRETFDYSGPGGFSINVEYKTKKSAELLISRVQKIYAHAVRTTKRLTENELSDSERAFIYKFLRGYDLGPSKIRHKSDFYHLSEMFCFIEFRTRTGGYSAFLDFVGAYHSGDLGSALYMLRLYVQEQIIALTFLAGDPNSNKKWLVAKLRRLPAQYDYIRNRFQSLDKVSVYDEGVSENFTALIGDYMDLLDDIFSAFRIGIPQAPSFYSLADALEITRHDRNVDLGGARCSKSKTHIRFSYDLRLRMFRRPRCGMRVLLQNVMHTLG